MANEVKAREPFIRMVKKDAIPNSKAWGIRIIAILISLVVNGVLIYLITGMSPIDVYVTMYNGVFSTSRQLWSTLFEAGFLLCVAVGLAPAFKMRFWNIGAEGQVLMGALATTLIMFYCPDISNGILLVTMFVASCVAGGVWAVIPAIFKAKYNTNETLFTLMMNYVAIQLVAAFSSIMSPTSSLSTINSGSKSGWLVDIFSNCYGNGLNVLIFLAVTVLMYVYLSHSKQGYEISVVGESENTARYAGINVKKVIIRTMFISGLICGIAGFVVVAGKNHTISTTTAGGYGFTAIIVAWLAKFNPIIMIIFSFFLAFLDKGASAVATSFNLNEFASEMIIGIILFFILASEFFINYKLVLRGNKKKGGK